MKKRLLSSIALAALLSAGLYAFAAFAPAAHAAPAANQTVIMRESGLSADVFYSGQFDTPSGVVSWRAGYGVSTGSIRTSSGTTISGPAVYAIVTEFNESTGVGFGAFTEEPTPVSASNVRIDKKLNTAALLTSVDVIVVVQDGDALPWGTAITLHVAPTQWTGVGPVTTTSATYHERSAGYNLLFHMDGRSRSATVDGGFSYTAPFNDGAISASDATSVNGQLSDSRSTSISIQRA